MQYKVNDTNYSKDFVQGTTTAELQDASGSLPTNSLQHKILADSNLNPKTTTPPDLHEKIKAKYVTTGSDT